MIYPEEAREMQKQKEREEEMKKKRKKIWERGETAAPVLIGKNQLTNLEIQKIKKMRERLDEIGRQKLAMQATDDVN